MTDPEPDDDAPGHTWMGWLARNHPIVLGVTVILGVCGGLALGVAIAYDAPAVIAAVVIAAVAVATGVWVLYLTAHVDH